MQLIWSIAVLLVLIVCSALISGSEVAFFSLSSAQLRSLEDEETTVAQRLIHLREKPKKLLATILISNNFVNIAIVIVTQLVIEALLPYETLLIAGEYLSNNVIGGYIGAPTLANGINFFLTVVLVTFILVLFGEVAPKIYANINNLRFARFMTNPLSFLNLIFTPISSILVKWGNGLEYRVSSNRVNNTGMSKEDLDAAIELTVKHEDDSQQDIDILKGIIKFGDLSAKQIMKPRFDVVGLEKEMTYKEVLNIVRESGYSRLPVYEEDFDHVIGILYVKDLLEYINENEDFDWLSLVRKTVLFVPESKKIDDLLRDFQSKRMHLSIVVNEFGGSEGIITLEDIMEEVIGDIKDEFDEEDDIDYIILEKDNYIFEGKTLLHDIAKVLGENLSFFDDVKGNADSLGGLIIEQLGDIPKPEKEILIKNVRLKIITVTNRRIGKVNLKVEKE